MRGGAAGCPTVTAAQCTPSVFALSHPHLRLLAVAIRAFQPRTATIPVAAAPADPADHPRANTLPRLVVLAAQSLRCGLWNAQHWRPQPDTDATHPPRGFVVAAGAAGLVTTRGASRTRTAPTSARATPLTAFRGQLRGRVHGMRRAQSCSGGARASTHHSGEFVVDRVPGERADGAP
eukprot:2768495-Rhodomonas_salina.2